MGGQFKRRDMCAELLWCDDNQSKTKTAPVPASHTDLSKQYQTRVFGLSSNTDPQVKACASLEAMASTRCLVHLLQCSIDLVHRACNTRALTTHHPSWLQKKRAYT